MPKISISQNTKTFFKTKPPTVLFLVCLLSFILVLLSLIAYVRTTDIHNPDEIDWNIFREKMASLDYCVKYPSQTSSVTTHTKNLNLEKKNTYFYELTFDIDYWGSLEGLKNLKTLVGKIDGFFIGREKEMLDIEFQIHKIFKNPVNSCDKRIINDKECHEYLISGCASLTASTRLFPKTQPPASCSFKKVDTARFSNQTAEFIIYKETPELPYHYWCPSTYGAKSIIKNTRDPNLTVLLTKIDKDKICRNLWAIIICLIIITFLILLCKVIGFGKKKASTYSYSQVTNM